MAAMAWKGVVVLVLLLHLGLAVPAFGDVRDVCPSYASDPTWKESLGERTTAVQVRVMRSLRVLAGTFQQGPKVLLNKPANADPNQVQGVRLVVMKADPSDSRDVFRVSVMLTLGFWEKFFSPVQLPGGRGPGRPREGATQDVTIMGDGTFHEGTGELCVRGCIGTVCKYKLSLTYPSPKTIHRVSAVGNLSSVVDESDKTFFDPIAIHSITDGPFQYTMNATVASECPKLAPDVVDGKLWHEEKVCSQGWASTHQVWSNQAFEVTWNSECAGANCSPFEEVGKTANGNTSSLRFDRIRCDGDRLQGLLIVTNSPSPVNRFVDPSASDGILIAEGTWDSNTGKMCMLACRLYGQCLPRPSLASPSSAIIKRVLFDAFDFSSDSLLGNRLQRPWVICSSCRMSYMETRTMCRPLVTWSFRDAILYHHGMQAELCLLALVLGTGKEDCQIAVTMQFPLTFTITQRSLVVGHMRSLRKKADPSYFKPISFRQVSSGLQVTRFTSVTNQPEYVYTKVETARTLCALNDKKASSGKYPSGVDWRDLEFHGVKDKRSGDGIYSFVNLNLFTFGDQFRTYGQLHVTAANVTGLGEQGIMNVSYSMYYQIGKLTTPESNMAGEGIYDPASGKLCLIGCQSVNLTQKGLEQLEGDGRKDCQIFFNVQLPPVDSKDALKGTVKSLRLPTDPLHFIPETFSGAVHIQALEAVWRVDLEIVLSVVMLSLIVVFIFLQLVYTKRYPETLPYISTSMLLLLSLAHMIPLVLNFEALFQKKNDYLPIQRAAGWPEVNEVIVRLTTMTAMLLQLRLLQLVWKSRVKSRATGELGPAVQERRVLYTILPLYFIGGVIAVLFHSLFGFRPYERQFLWRGNEGGLWWDIKAYGGLLLDFHLFPQVVGNILWGAKEQAPLSKPFYFGMALVRSLPHIYDLCRKFKFIPAFADTYLYANPEWDFYSVTSDILIPLVILLLAIMVYVQQRWGGRCLLPRRWRNSFEYEKVDVAPI
jgi:hypothetical protein